MYMGHAEFQHWTPVIFRPAGSIVSKTGIRKWKHLNELWNISRNHLLCDSQMQVKGLLCREVMCERDPETLLWPKHICNGKLQTCPAVR